MELTFNKSGMFNVKNGINFINNQKLLLSMKITFMDQLHLTIIVQLFSKTLFLECLWGRF